MNTQRQGDKFNEHLHICVRIRKIVNPTSLQLPLEGSRDGKFLYNF